MDGDRPAPEPRKLLDGLSMELNPRDSATLEEAAERLDPGTEVSLVWIPGRNPMDMVQAAAELKRAGHFPMPHVGARHLESAAQLERLAKRFKDAGVDRILVIGGDREKPAGPYDSSLAVIETGVFQRAGITRMAVAGFPEGNPHIPAKTLEEALAAKVSRAHAEGLRLSIVTQFSFEAAPILAWVRGIRARGIEVPVRIGIAGPANWLTLMGYAVRCGVGASLRRLTENPAFARILLERGPEPMIRELAASLGEGQAGELAIAGLHFYVFGGFQKTMASIDAARQSMALVPHA